MHINTHIRFVAIDFETTGLDLHKDEPIQVGVVVADHTFTIIESYSSLIKPEKDIKKLKSIVSHITGLTLEDLQGSPSMMDVLPILQKLLTPETILVGHNIAFDLGFINKYRPEFVPQAMIDTFYWSQMLLHYEPSYALEVLRKRVHDKQGARLQFFDPEGKNVDMEREQYHDALYDSFVSLGLFRYLSEKLQKLTIKYSSLNHILSKDENMNRIFDLSSEKKKTIVTLPKLVKPQPTEKKVDEPDGVVDLKNTTSKRSWYIGNISFREFIARSAPNSPIIYAVHTRQKLDVLKHHLVALGYDNLGFAKEEQDWDHERMEELANKDVLADFEVSFFVKYFSHHQQGLRVVDVKNKDYRVQTLCKQDSAIKQYPIMITSHTGLYHLLENEKYKDYIICYLDADWRHYTYNRHISQKVDFQFFLSLLDNRYYVFRRRATLHGFDIGKSKQMYAMIYAFKQSFTVFTGTLGVEITKKFTGVDASSLEIDPIIGNSDFYQSNKLRPRLVTLADQCFQQWGDESSFVMGQRKRISQILDSLIVVEKKMQDNKYLHYSFSLVHTYTEFGEFLDYFQSYQVLFLSHFKESNTDLFPQVMPSTRHVLDEFRTPEQVMKHILGHTYTSAFILSSAKHVSQKLFDMITNDSKFRDYVVLAENITGGTGKNIYRMQHARKTLVIGGYYFLLSIFAKQEHLDTIIIHHASGPLKNLILADCLYYDPFSHEK